VTSNVRVLEGLHGQLGMLIRTHYNVYIFSTDIYIYNYIYIYTRTMECVCPHALPVSEVLRCYKSDEQVGLSDEQVAHGFAKHGLNGNLIIFVVECIV